MNTTLSSNIHRTAKNPFFPYIEAGKLSQVVLGLNYELHRQLIRLNLGGLKKIAPCPANTPSKKENTFITLNAVIKNRPEAAIELLKTLSTELAQENYPFAQLHRAFTTGNLNHLPDPAQLVNQLRTTCAVDSFKDKQFVSESLTNLIENFLRPVQSRIERGEQFDPAQLNQLLDLSVVLLKGLGKLADNQVTTVGTLKIAHLNQLVDFYNTVLETVLPVENRRSIEALRGLLERKSTAIATVQRYALDLRRLDNNMRADRDVVMAAVKQVGWSLGYASDDLKNERDIVKAAIDQNGLALGYASQEIRKDRSMVMAAINKTGYAYQYACAELKQDVSVAIAAVKQNQNVFDMMSIRLQRNPDIIEAAFGSAGKPELWPFIL